MTKKLRRALIGLLSLLMAFGAVPALSGSGDATIFRVGKDGIADSLSAMAYYDDALYIFTYGQSYYTWTRESGALAEHPFDQAFALRADGGYDRLSAVLAGSDGLYALVISTVPAEDGSGNQTFAEARLRGLAIAEDGAITLGEGVELEWDDVIETYGDYDFPQEVRFPFLAGDSLVFSSYGSADVYTNLYVCDAETGDMEICHVDAGGERISIEGLCAHTEGRALIASYTGSREDEPVVFYSADLATGEATELFEAPAVNYSLPSNLLYDAAGDTLYYTMNGELVAAGLGMGAAETVATVRIDPWSGGVAALTDDGYFICSDNATILLRNTDPAQRAASSLTVHTNSAPGLGDAWYAFTEEYTDVDVVYTSLYKDEDEDDDDIAEAILTQSDSVDIYTLHVSSGEYAALFDRGYLADLSGSPVLMDAVSAMYPAIQDAVMKDGALLALPIGMYASCWGWNPDAAEQLGLSAEDMPESWMELLRFLQGAPDLLGDADAAVFHSYPGEEDAKTALLSDMLSGYVLYLQKTGGAEMSFDTEILRGLLAEYEKIDFSALKLTEGWDGEGEGGALFSRHLGVDAAYSYETSAFPMPLAIAEGEEPMIAGGMTIAIVNPYSKNADLAIRYLECAASLFSEDFLANTCPDRNDPIVNPYYEANLQEYEGMLETMQAEYDKAGEDEKDDWQARINDYREDYEFYKAKGGWLASAEEIAAYRAYAPYIQIKEHFPLVENSDAVDQYLDGAIGADAMLKQIDKQFRMMLLEGAQ